MNRYRAIEGLRGWMAWAVVACHLVLFSSSDTVSHFWHLVRRSGDFSALAFIAISGFTICHLVVTKRESYSYFLKRRALRLFPAYLVALPLGLISYYVAATHDAVHPAAEYALFTQDTVDSLVAYPWPHMGLNVTMLQGVVPDEILPLSEFVILAPAWVLSLIWQFYLIAPLLILGLITPGWRWFVVAMIVAGAFAYDLGFVGHFGRPSMILGGGPYLLFGISLRLAMNDLSWIRSNRLSRLLLESKLPLYLGSRSYSTYLIHYPIIQILVYTLPIKGLTPVEVLLYLVSPTIVLVVVGSELLYKCIELPAVRLGKQRGFRYVPNL